MTLNTFDDGEALLSKELDSLVNAINQEYVKDGLVASKGAGDYDVDFTSGTIVLNQTEVSVASDTKTLTSAAADADLDPGEFRVDLITADSAGSINVAEGVASTTPVTPDIPTDEVVLTTVIVDGSASALTSGDIRDARALATLDNLQDPIYGDGSDGSITRASSTNENGIIHATDYTVESGVTLTVSNGVLIVHATDTITIDGTITASGTGASGGTGGAGGGANSDGTNGNQGGQGDFYTSTGTGGAGGTGAFGDGAAGGAGAGGGGGGTNDPQTGGDGADGQATTAQTTAVINALNTYLAGVGYDVIYDLTALAGSGGGGGGGGAGDNNGGGGTGGTGGDGGGVVLLVAPTINITGTIEADGADGANGQNGQANGGAGGGGGGGGTGGSIILVTPNLSNSGSLTVAGGTGGTGGTADNDAGFESGDGGDGGAGTAGDIIQIEQ